MPLLIFVCLVLSISLLHYNYRMNFQIHYDAGNLTAAAVRAQSQIIRNQSTIRYIQNLQEVDQSDSESDSN